MKISSAKWRPFCVSGLHVFLFTTCTAYKWSAERCHIWILMSCRCGGARNRKIYELPNYASAVYIVPVWFVLCGILDICMIQYNVTAISGRDEVIKWKHFPHYWPFVRGIHQSPVNSSHKGQWRGALMFSLICAWINGWVNHREAGDLRHHHAHYDVIIMIHLQVAQWWLQSYDDDFNINIYMYKTFLKIVSRNLMKPQDTVRIRYFHGFSLQSW